MSEYREIITKAVVAKGQNSPNAPTPSRLRKNRAAFWVVGLLTTSMTLKKLEKR